MIMANFTSSRIERSIPNINLNEFEQEKARRRGFKKGSRIGLLIDMFTREISFFKDGEDLGVAFRIPATTSILYPFVQLNQGISFSISELYEPMPTESFDSNQDDEASSPSRKYAMTSSASKEGAGEEEQGEVSSS